MKSGFTLIETMITVAIIGVMAALAYAGYSRWLSYARTSETKSVIGAIVLGETMYFDDTQGYLKCSSSYTDYYPGKPSNRKRTFDNPGHGDHGCWRMLNVNTTSPTYMAYTVVAGRPGSAPPAPLTQQTVSWPASPAKPWFVVHVTGDVDADNIFSYFVASSFQPGEIYAEREDE